MGRSETDSPLAKHRRRESRWGPRAGPAQAEGAARAPPSAGTNEPRYQSVEARPALLRSASAPVHPTAPRVAAAPAVRHDAPAPPPAALTLLRPDAALSVLERQQRQALLAVRVQE
eukprot:CAMPEP_0196783228 /NCGR_PEP_ID=MMETSP1104-20130614/13125_1 /TAXON_ID=33652 /ORGANISM="Cafeteria sp., Strain Caron Lab Isolate" /LENGTH=115 /DNA_ID=CAMNT_0042153475 /DNA_START=20 /DNA_END=364 /DNA_ORIENTATION=+